MEATVTKETSVSVDLYGLGLLKEAYTRAAETQRTYRSLLASIPYEPHIDTVWDVYVGYMSERGIDPDQCRNVYNRQKFLLVAMALFCPQALVGSKMCPGLRPRIARMFDIRSETPVSRNTASAVMFYSRYSDFKNDCDIILSRAVARIESKEKKNISQNICITQNI